MTNPTQAAADHLYTRQFFQVFAANMLFMTGVGLQFHFGQYVEYLGHGVDTLGRILSISVVGTLLIRLHLGRWIDRFGCRPAWLVATLVMAVIVGSVQFTARLWLIVVLRTLSEMAMASVLTTLAVFAAQIAPLQRRAESIGSLGLSGFCGIIIGTTLGDWIFSEGTESIAAYRIFFSASAACSLLAGGVIGLLISPASGAGVSQAAGCSPLREASRVSLGGHAGLRGAARAEARGSGEPAAPKNARPSQIRVILQHWPGTIMLVGVVFAMVFCVQSMYLERFTEARGFKDIKVFFLVYGPTAMTLRVIFRRMPERIGRTRTLLGGLLLFAAGLFLLSGVQSEWELALPALLMGAGHCFIFPSMVDLAAGHLPGEHRGTGTALILGAGDLGRLIGFVAMGELIDDFGFEVALVVLAATVLTGASVFACARRDTVFSRRRESLR